jgi:hypothetical protein
MFTTKVDRKISPSGSNRPSPRNDSNSKFMVSFAKKLSNPAKKKGWTEGSSLAKFPQSNKKIDSSQEVKNQRGRFGPTVLQRNTQILSTQGAANHRSNY